MLDVDTKIIGRFHTKPNARGLNIYNPFFQATGINAVYLLFHNPSCQPLVQGLRSLNLTGAISSGFENDPSLLGLLDELDESAIKSGRVGIITNKNGVLKGFSRGGVALLHSLSAKHNFSKKKIVIVGAGILAKSFMSALDNLPLDQQPSEIEIFNRTPVNAESIANNFSIVNKISGLDELPNAKGDIFINISRIGSSVPDIFFTEKLIRNFGEISDVTFETENTNLIELAKKLNLRYSTGWDMFTYYCVECLRDILEISVDPVVMRKYIARGLSIIV
jgi:shikimate 5-dehydrogenase